MRQAQASPAHLVTNANRHAVGIERQLHVRIIGLYLQGAELVFQPFVLLFDLLDLRDAIAHDPRRLEHVRLGLLDVLDTAFQVFHHSTPVLPKPPSPRSVSSNSSTRRNVGSSHGTITSWAMRSPASTLLGVFPAL